MNCKAYQWTFYLNLPNTTLMCMSSWDFLEEWELRETEENRSKSETDQFMDSNKQV